MNIALRIVRWLLGVGISVALTLWIFLATINATIANRDVVKGWLTTSGVYENLPKSLIDVSAVSPDPLIKESVQEAFTQTFTAGFVGQSIETAIDASYSWLNGSTNAITFTIPVDEKKTEFYANLTAALAPKLRTLPPCATRVPVNTENLTCLPQGIDATSYAAQLTRPASGQELLKEPLTNETFKDTPNLPWLPTTMQLVHTGLWALPVVMLVFSALYVVASPDRLRGVSHIARRLTLGAAITLVGGVFIWFSSTSIDLSSTVDTSGASNATQRQAIVSMLINPLARTILPSVGQALTLYSGVFVAIAGATWLGVFTWRHRRGSGSPTPRSMHSGPQVPPPPADPRETHLPTPLERP